MGEDRATEMAIVKFEPQGFVYLWVNRNNGKWYIGSHAGTLDDGYVGSGKVFQRAVKKHGLDVFERTILYWGWEFKEQETHILQVLNAAAERFVNKRKGEK